MPITSEISEAVTNQPIALSPMRPMVSALPIFATPATSVQKTSGAMIILINRRNTSEKTEM